MPMWFAFLLAVTFAPAARERIALIEFFGYQGLDADAIRKALPVHEGGWYEDKDERPLREAIKSVTGSEPTDVASVCCEPDGRSILFIGLPGKSTSEFHLDAQPTGAVRLPQELLALFARLDNSEEAAARKGGDAAMEDVAQGYRLVKYPAARVLEMQLREYALAHEPELEDVLQNSSDNEQRSRAADALGYAERSQKQIAALVRACRDADSGVRNNATRALSEIIPVDPAMAKHVPAAAFVEMISSHVWTDRNKASMVLMALTQSREPELLAQLKAEAWEPLLEMSRWRSDHATTGRIILGRVLGMPDDQLMRLAFGKPQAFLNALGLK